MKTLDIRNTEDLSKKVSDVKIVGDPDMWKLLCKASSKKEGWMKSTKGMIIGQKLIIQVTTQQRNPDGSYVISEAVTSVYGNYKFIKSSNGSFAVQNINN